MIHRTLVAATLLLACAHAQAQRAPSPGAGLKSAFAEPSRILVVQDTANLFYAFSAGSVRLADASTIEVPSGADVIVFDDKIVLSGGATRKPVKGDFRDALPEIWSPPFNRKEQVYWMITGRRPPELIPITKGRFTSPQLVKVKSLVTWWCKSGDVKCHPPK